MSLRVGLGASQADLDVQGEIDFDFFEESDCTNGLNKTVSSDHSTATKSPEHCTRSIVRKSRSKRNPSYKQELNLKECEAYSTNFPESCSSRNYDKPRITISCDDETGIVQKTTIETVIPTPFTYEDIKRGKGSSSKFTKGKMALSPYLKSKVFKDENEVSDDSSISSMSESESSVSEDSFELNESDSMTDVSALASPFNCYTPTFCEQNVKAGNISTPDDVKETKKEGVKFTDEVDKEQCTKCNSIDFHELVSAMNRLQMKQNVNSMGVAKCNSPVITHNAKFRKNLSFSNEEVRRIDNDNQVLLKKIMAQQNRAKSHPLCNAQVRSSSAVNRHRYQRQIELENLALLKRLESTKPSRNLSRSHLLRDYDRRSSGVLSRSSSRSSYPSSSQTSVRNSNLNSGRSSAVSIKSSNSTNHASLCCSRSASAST